MRDLVGRESGCCSFFTFTTTPGPDLVGVEVSVEQAHEAGLDAPAVRVAAAGEQR